MRRIGLERLKVNASDPVVVLGGGVHGAAVFRELALNGVPGLLLDTHDFCQGATNASSRIAHGGLRYLEQGDFKLVREALSERNHLLEHAPHRTEQVVFNIPIESWVGGTFQRARQLIFGGKGRIPPDWMSLKLGLLLYDWMGRGHEGLSRHRFVSPPPGLASSVKKVARYVDGRLTHPEGLVLEVIEEALDVCSDCAALNYVDWSVIADRRITIRTEGAENVTVTPTAIVNATGVHVDGVNERLGLSTALVSGVRGTHLVLRHPELSRQLAGEIYYFDDGAGRLVVVCPLGETVLLGTTERVEKPEGQAEIKTEEVRYLLGAISRLFKGVVVTPADVIAATTGYRALKAFASGSATAASRDHELFEDICANGVPVFSMVGGKWTTARAFGAETADAVLARLGVARTVSTKSRSYIGARTEAGEMQSVPTPREIEELVRRQSVLHVEDVVLRRTSMAIEGRATPEAIRQIADIVASVRKKDAAWVEIEVERCMRNPAINFDAVTLCGT